jgi:hypothetical protein
LHNFQVLFGGAAFNIELEMPFFRFFQGVNQLKYYVGISVGHKAKKIPKLRTVKGFSISRWFLGCVNPSYFDSLGRKTHPIFVIENETKKWQAIVEEVKSLRLIQMCRETYTTT